MNECFIVIVTRGMRVHLPPEIYERRSVALREVNRWVRVLSHRANPEIIEDAPNRVRLGRGLLIQIVDLPFVQGWQACPLWVNLTCSQRTFPSLDLTVMAIDDPEARQWVIDTARRQIPEGSSSEGAWHEVLFTSRGIDRYVAAHRLKRITSY